ncbi:MAG TPA: Do family serine endopeptidase [Bacteroidales bacterium]|nr:Do family serine endopeptidase [Bacteroidales bacterium]HNS46846.1 Do family serine endopeptidase [Bacteroidales bacterium]
MNKFLSLVLAAVVGALLTWVVIGSLGHRFKSDNVPVSLPVKAPVTMTSDVQVSAPQVLPDFSEAAGKTINAVVHVMTQYQRQMSAYDYFFDWRDFFGEPDNRPNDPMYMGSGSGVIISGDGYIVTNNHVVEGADQIQVVLNDKRTYDATIVGTDPSTDLAVIRIKEESLPYITFGDSDELRVGEWVLAVGNPFNLTSTVTAGIVSAKARNINILQTPDGTSAIESFIQTDAAVNKGNSGGALVNTRGELVGINAAIASSTGYYSGYSFAIPSNLVKKVVADLKEYGEVQRALLGVSIRDIDSKFATDLGLKEIKGVYVAGVSDNGSAKAAGVESGDIILQIDDKTVNSTSELLEQIGQKRPGEEVILVVNRKNQEKSFRLQLKNRAGTVEVVQKQAISNAAALLGAKLEPVTNQEKERLGINNGVKVTGLQQGKLSDAGIREGFIIIRIDKQTIHSVADIENVLVNASGGILIEGIYPNGLRAYYGVGW